MQRLFFGIWPNKSVLRHIQTSIKNWSLKQGWPVKPGNIHMTLAFIGDADAAYRECLQRAA